MEKVTLVQEGTKQESQPSTPIDTAASKEGKLSRSLSPTEASIKSSSAFEDSFDYPEDETTRSKMISAAVQQEDEFLEYLMSLPTVAKERKPISTKSSKQPHLMRSTSEKAGAKVGLDHLDNLCKLMEQLGDLREQNSKLQRRVQYLEDLKNLQEMHKQLQQETNQRQIQEAELLQSLQRHRETNFPSESPRRSKKLCRHRQSLQPSSKQRERSQSVGIDDLNDFPEDYQVPTKQTKRRQRRSIAGFASGNKSKVSKWTKVKEAFRWEKASVVMTLPETKSQDSGLGGINHHDGGRYLRVPVGEMLSGSPSADSVISGHSMCSSGGPSTGEYALPMTTTMSSSSSSEDLDIDLNYSDILTEFGPERSASATDSIGGHMMALEPRRISLTRTLEEEDASRRAKSLDGEETPSGRHQENKEGVKSSVQQPKSHKTPWGKVKDIIQTRKDSLRQRQHRNSHGDSVKSVRPRRRSQKADVRDGVATSDHEEETPVFDALEEQLGEMATLPCDDIADGLKSLKPLLETAGDARRHKTSTISLGSYPQSALTNRRLTPMLTITLPSTEELRQLNMANATTKCINKPPPSPQVEERSPKLSPLPGEDTIVAKHEYRQQGGVSPSPSVGTSPPAHRRSSKWTKVKKAFLTSAAPGHREDEASGQLSVSGPSSPYRTLSFFYETDPDELSGGELAEGTGDDEESHRGSTSEPTSLQVEIQRNYEELQQKLSQEFHKKLNEWERMKASATSPNVGRATGVAGTSEENYHHDKGFKRKMDEWEKIKHREGTANYCKRDSVALQPLDEDNLSPHFRKKLHEWQRIKKGGPREESHHSRKKIVEWQLWRTGSGKQGGYDQDDFHRKLQEWERMKSTSPCESPTSKEAGHESDRNSSGAKTPSPGVVRKESEGSGMKKSPTGSAKTPPKVNTQKEKELQWLEKELQKIKREKQRLEREREKYLEREARLEKMRRAVGSNPGKQEVLVQTSTGFFRFQGISEKFTRRLYEWEKARGITPEASTFALLDPGYRPPGERTENNENGGLTRSKSASSVTNIAGGSLGATITHQPSSLSLNDVEGLEQAAMADARASSEPQLHDEEEEQEYDEPAAVIVDVEDVIEETAALLEETPAVESQTPVYCYAPEEVTRLIDSSGSESERDNSGMVRRTDSVRTESSYKLIEENINLLSKLQIKGDICRKLETELEELEQKIDHVRKKHELEIERLRLEETEIQELTTARAAVSLAPDGINPGVQEALVDALRSRIQELERRQERLKREGATLKDSFAVHSEQQAALAQNLVGKMKQLQQVNSNMASMDQDQPSAAGCLSGCQEDAVTMVQDLSTQLLSLAERLEVALGERNTEIRSLRFELEDRRRAAAATAAAAAGAHPRRRVSEDNLSSTSPSLESFTASENNNLLHSVRPYLPRQSSTEVSQLPSLLTSKVMELKQGLNYLCSTTEPRAKEKNKDETTTYVLKIPTKKEIITQLSAKEDSEEYSPPVTSVTVTPAFLKRQKRVTESETRSTVERDILVNPSQEDLRESFCSAVSSSASSSNDIYTAKNIGTKNVDDKRLRESGEHGEKNKAVLRSFKLTRSLGNVGLQLRLVENGNNCDQDGNSSPVIQRKAFSTRRASDTNVAYKRGEKGVKNDTVLPKSSSNVKLLDEPTEMIPLSRENNHQVEQSYTHLCEASSNQSTEESLVPVSVFVPTTRKIFAPVRRDSKGKASSVIGYVVQEDIETEEGAVSSPVIDASSSKANGIATTPQWMIMRSRSASASPAMPRRKIIEDGAEGANGFLYRGLRSSPDKAAELGKLKLSSESLKENEQRKLSRFIRDEGVELPHGCIKIDSQKELLLSSVRPTTPLGFPPLPPSPSPGRRDLFKQIAKDTAPSIRMMIAKYNQKLTEQDGGRSPEVSVSGSGSPVAWRSPVAERRVRAQMTKYQEEVQRVLQQGGRRAGRMGYGEVQKSASAGVIRSPDLSKATKCGSISDKIGSPSMVERRGILKSSSAGSIKPVGVLTSSKPIIADPMLESKLEAKMQPVPTIAQEKEISLDEPLNLKKSSVSELETFPAVFSSLPRGSDASSDMGSPPMTRLRALRIQKAKEEFLTRGPGGRSWTSDGDTPTPSTSSASLEPIWIKNVAMRNIETTKNRLSQISVGSESSYGSQVLPFTPEEMEDDDDGSLMKSASAGMIHVDTKTYKNFTLESGTDSLPRTHKEKTNSHNKFGISSLTSKFRKVKMRKSKDKETGAKPKMNTVSLLCRQSLLVDINKKEAGSSGEGPSLSKSCPSSPVLQRTSSTENTSRQETGSWISYPARKIFKPK